MDKEMHTNDMETAADVVLATELDAAVEERIVKAISKIFTEERYRPFVEDIMGVLFTSVEHTNAVRRTMNDIDHKRHMERLEAEKYFYQQQTTTGTSTNIKTSTTTHPQFWE